MDPFTYYNLFIYEFVSWMGICQKVLRQINAIKEKIKIKESKYKYFK